MKHIESSKLINLADAVETATLKSSLIERMRNIFHIETVDDSAGKFTLTAIGKDIPCHCTFNVLLKADGKHARLVIDGSAKITAPTKILYALGVLVLLVLGQFHGIINTSSSGSAMDLLVFLFLGIFVIYDINRKLAEPQYLLDRILGALATEYGA